MIRFLNLFKLDDEENDYLILKTAEKGNGQQLLAAIDLKFNYESNILDPNIEHILLNTCDNSSILKSAIDGKNSEIVKFLVEKFGFIIEKLDFDHKKIIIDQTENQEILILLITKVDFPFPTNRQNTNDEIQQLMKSKDEFHKAIKNIKESVCVAIHDLSAFLVQQISVY
ncbi:hypothetical protein PVAND_014516 [Polypedilum vanderplanki]|uniref:Ankyrin repeat protein n=1 Tax=Polypedilum vanderplanki TaxID=319348 RepID=A0A9J6B9M0_POLVA|nr:hypothetical protein PVAND_014516 [Polypedilum vanderplanki]